MWTLARSSRDRLWRDLAALFGRRALRRVDAMLAVLVGEHPPPDTEPQRVQNLWMPGLPSRAWYEPDVFPWVARAEAAASAIAAEAAAVDRGEGTFTPYLGSPEEQANPASTVSGLRSPTFGWHAYFFLRDGRWRGEHLARCPHAARLFGEVPLGIGDVMFSRLAAGTEIPPHYGLDNLSLTCHLGLSVPDGCSLTVCDETRTWREGRCLIFDDTFRHFAENRAPVHRLVLLFDFWHPSLAPAEVSALRYLLPRLRRVNAAS